MVYSVATGYKSCSKSIKRQVFERYQIKLRNILWKNCDGTLRAQK